MFSRKRRRHWLTLFLCILAYVSAVIAYVVWSNHEEKKTVMAEIDKRLLLAAKGLKYMLAPDFHDRATDNTSISREEETRNRITVSNFAFETGFQWAYTLAEKDGKFYFSAPSVSEEELKERESWYFYPYEDIPQDFVLAYHEKKTVYTAYSDQWGTFRSVAVAERSPGGRWYLACADYDISYVKGLLRQKMIRSVFTAVGFLCFTFPFILIYRNIFKSYNAELESVNEELSDHKLHLEELVEKRTEELTQSNRQLQSEIVERERVEKELVGHLAFLENMEKIDRVCQKTTDLEQMMDNVLRTVLSVFDCDRAALVYPCDPDAPTWKVPIECTKPEYPGAFSRGNDFPMTSGMRKAMREALDSEEPIRYDSESDRIVPKGMALQFSIKAAMSTAIYPKSGPPWMFSIHQCSYERIWTNEEQRLFREIGRRFSDALSSLLYFHDLLESEERYRDLVENINEVIFTTDSDSRFTYVSPTVKSVLDYEPSELIDCSFHDLVCDEDHSLLDSHLRKILSNAQDGTELRMYTKSRKSVWIYTSGKPVLSEEKVIGIRGILTDIDQRKKAEEEKKILEERLSRSRKMEALGLLAGGVAHDLNNILSAIVSYPDLLLMDLAEDSPLRNPILTMQKAGKKAAAIVEDLLALSRRGVASTDILNVNDLVQDYLNSPEHKRIKSLYPHVELRSQFSPTLLNIRGSSFHLNKVVMNLVLNAAEALPEGGTVLISTENRYVDTPLRGYDTVEEGDYVVLTVKDNGTGISPEDLSRIFEPFYTKKIMGRSGTGLGLAVVWGTVQDHNGYIGVKSSEGKGTTFELYFPSTRESHIESKSQIPLSRYLGKGEKILVVDDVEEQREIATKILLKLGYVADSVPSGNAAIRYLKSDHADLLVLDMIMEPGIDGLDTYEEILKFRPGQKAIIASGFSESDRVKKVQQLGAGEYVKKPYTLERLGLAVRNELDRASAEPGFSESETQQDLPNSQPEPGKSATTGKNP